MNILIILHSITLLLLPSYILRSSIFGIPFSGLEVMVVLSVLATAIYAIKAKARLKSFKTFFDLPIFFVFIASVLSLLVTPDLRGGLGIFKAYFLEPILFYYSLVFVARNVKSIRFIYVSIIGSVLLVAGLGLLQKITGQFIFAEHEWNQGRISAFYNSANAVALLIGPIIPLIIALFFLVKRNIAKVFCVIVILFLTLIMLWTKSKGGIIAEAFTIGIFMFGLLAHRFKRLKSYWWIVPLFYVMFAIGFFGAVYKAYDPMIHVPGGRIEDDTLQIRYATWSSTSEILQQRPVLGTGLNGFKTVYDNYKLFDFQEDFQYPHTIVYNFWTETGLLGLISFIVLLCYCFYVCIKLNNHRLNFLGLGLVAAFSCIVIHGLVDVPYFKNDLAVQFWSLVAMAQLLHEKTKERI